jgi:hypothetical protein
MEVTITQIETMTLTIGGGRADTCQVTRAVPMTWPALAAQCQRPPGHRGKHAWVWLWEAES